MNSTVLLLILLSSTFILSRMKVLRQVQGLLVVPLLIGMGVLFGRYGLFPIDEGLSLALEPVVRTILVWMGFLAGLRVLPQHENYQWRRQGLLRVLHIAVTIAALMTLGYLLLGTAILWSLPTTVGASITLAALFATSSYFSQARLSLDESLTFTSYGDNLLIIVCFFLAGLLFFSQDLVVYVASHLGIPILISLVALLLLGRKEKLATPDRLVIGGTVILCAGWVVGVSALEVIVGFLLGAFISLVRWFPAFDDKFLSTEVPLRLTLYFYAGLVMEITWLALLVALILTSARFAFKWWTVQKHSERRGRFSSVYRFSTLSIPLTLSLALSHKTLTVGPALLAVMCFAYLINDLLLIAELTFAHASKSYRQKSKGAATS